MKLFRNDEKQPAKVMNRFETLFLARGSFTATTKQAKETAVTRV